MATFALSCSRCIVLCTLFYTTLTSGTDYCSISKDHTMCKYQGVNPQCGKTISRGITSEEIKVALKLHNDLRSTIANGNEKRGYPGPQKQAADMLQMIWDPELAKIAQRWADQCDFNHDRHRQVERFHVGQNLYRAQRSMNDKVDWSDVVHGWYDEVMDFDQSLASAFQPSGYPETGHYTQLVWSKSRHLGCGAFAYQKPGTTGYEKIIVCNYGPAGNVVKAPLYKAGRSCSACPTDYRCSEKYKGLCSTGFEEDISYDDSAFDSSQLLQPTNCLLFITVLSILFRLFSSSEI